jgi:hypothetical protein
VLEEKKVGGLLSVGKKVTGKASPEEVTWWLSEDGRSDTSFSGEGSLGGLRTGVAGVAGG